MASFAVCRTHWVNAEPLLTAVVNLTPDGGSGVSGRVVFTQVDANTVSWTVGCFVRSGDVVTFAAVLRVKSRV